MSKVGVNNADFLVARTIESAPHNLFIRELFQNALEASTHAKEPKVWFLSTDPADYGFYEDGLGDYGFNNKKLTFWNNGKGMTADELRSATDLSSTFSKKQSMHQNFGVGLTTCAGVNKSGLIVVSYKNKKCNLVMIRKEITESNDDVYVREDFYETDGVSPSGWKDIAEIPQALVNNFSFPSDEDEWTAVICCGDLPEQNTVERPYDPAHNRSIGWLLNDLYKRYAAIPKNIKVRSLLHGLDKRLESVAFKPIFNFLETLDDSKNVRFETIIDNDINMKFTYVYDGPYGKGGVTHQNRPTTTVNNPSTVASFSGLVFKNEIYDIHESDKGWKQAAARCGILYDAKYFRIFPELLNPEIIQDEYRQFVKRRDLQKTTIVYSDFYGYIQKNMPEWFKEKIKEHYPTSLLNEDIRNDLQKYLDSLLITETVNHDNSSDRFAMTSKNPGAGFGLVASKSSNNAPVGKPNKISRVSFGTKHTISVTVPEIIYIDTEDKMHTASVENLEHHAAEYVTGQAIYINCFYDVIEKAVDKLMLDYTHLPDEKFDDIKVFAKEIAQTEMARIVGRAIVRCIARNQYKGFDRDDMEKAFHPVSLSIHADRIEEEIDKYRGKLQVKVSEMLNQEMLNGNMTDAFNLKPLTKTGNKIEKKQELIDKVVVENPCFEF